MWWGLVTFVWTYHETHGNLELGENPHPIGLLKVQPWTVFARHQTFDKPVKSKMGGGGGCLDIPPYRSMGGA